MPEENLTAGNYRKQIYSVIQDTIGRNLTENEHKFLSNILKAYVNAHAPTKPLETAPLKHLWTCTNCAKELVVVGKHENKKIIIKAKRNEKKIQNS